MPRGRPGVNEVVVEIEVAPVNGADLLFAAGWFGGYPDVRAPMEAEGDDHRRTGRHKAYPPWCGHFLRGAGDG
ncbi:hypothetical protein ACWCOV_31985 [Kribbella sp. NPDC002412]